MLIRPFIITRDSYQRANILEDYKRPEWLDEIIKDPNYKPPYTGLVFDNGKLIKK